jgi:hypothetical protein
LPLHWFNVSQQSLNSFSENLNLKKGLILIFFCLKRIYLEPFYLQMKPPLLKILFLLSVSFISGVTSAQRFLPGYYVNKSNDTIRGYISKKNLKIRASLDFKDQLNTSTKNFFPFEILGYGTDSLHIESRQERIQGTQSLTNKEFYRVIFHGQLSLLKGRGNYFTIRSDTMDSVLPIAKRGILIYYTKDQPELKRTIENMRFDEEHLVEVFERYHNSKSFQYFRTYLPPKHDKIFNLTLFAGYNYSNLTTQKIDEPQKKFNSSYAPLFGLNLVFLPPSRERGYSFYIQPRVSRELFQYQKTSQSQFAFSFEDIVYESVTLKIPVGCKIDLLHKMNWLLYFSPGGFLQKNFALNSERKFDSGDNGQLTITDQSIPLYSDLSFGYGAALGLEKMISSHIYFIEFYFDSSFPGNFTRTNLSLAVGRRIYNYKNQ